MHVILANENFIERIFVDKNGRFVQAVFCVYEKGGRIKARLVSAVYLDENISIENKTRALAGFVCKNVFGCDISFKKETISPFFGSKILFFSGSKPRAPTL